MFFTLSKYFFQTSLDLQMQKFIELTKMLDDKVGPEEAFSLAKKGVKSATVRLFLDKKFSHQMIDYILSDCYEKFDTALSLKSDGFSDFNCFLLVRTYDDEVIKRIRHFKKFNCSQALAMEYGRKILDQKRC